MKDRTPKRYPMNGPSLVAQEMMQRPRLNRKWLRDYFKNSQCKREETVAVAYLK